MADNEIVQWLTRLLKQGRITPDVYVEGLRALDAEQPQERPTPAPRQKRERPTPAPRQKRERPTPALRLLTDKEFNELMGEIYEDGLVFHKTPWTIGSFLRGWQMDVPGGHPLGADPRAFLEGVRPQIHQKLTEEILDLNGVKFQLALKVQLSKANHDGTEEFTSPVLRNKQEALLQAHEINETLDRAFPRILETLEKWTQRGSGWVVERVETLWLDIAWYQPLRGGSYIPLPAAVKNKHAVINVKNKDEHCLRWALRAALFIANDHSDQPSKYPINDGLDFTGIDTPHQSPKFRGSKSRTT